MERGKREYSSEKFIHDLRLRSQHDQYLGTRASSGLFVSYLSVLTILGAARCVGGTLAHEARATLRPDRPGDSYAHADTHTHAHADDQRQVCYTRSATWRQALSTRPPRT